MSTLLSRSLTALTLVAAIASTAEGAEHSLDPSRLADLLEQTRSEMRMPGLRAAVHYPDGEIVRAAVGLADKKSRQPLDDEIGMPGGSTGKTFVAALTMLLVEDGLFALDDPVARWLGDEPWFARLPNADSIEIRHLLSHSAGIKDYPATFGFQLAMMRRVLRHGSARFEPEELIRFVLDRRPLFPPGEGFRYTDAGYLVLGLLIERATGETYYDLLSRRVLDPLELEGARPADQSVLSDIAIGYMGGGRTIKKDGRMKFDPTSEWTGGGLVLTPTALARFVGALAAGEIVAPESVRQMVNGGWRDPAEPELRYGYGLFVIRSGRLFGHGGRWPGYRTHFTHFSDSGVTIAVQTNRDGRVDLEEVVRRIARATRLAAVASPTTETEPPGD